MAQDFARTQQGKADRSGSFRTRHTLTAADLVLSLCRTSSSGVCRRTSGGRVGELALFLPRCLGARCPSRVVAECLGTAWHRDDLLPGRRSPRLGYGRGIRTYVHAESVLQSSRMSRTRTTGLWLAAGCAVWVLYAVFGYVGFVMLEWKPAVFLLLVSPVPFSLFGALVGSHIRRRR